MPSERHRSRSRDRGADDGHARRSGSEEGRRGHRRCDRANEREVDSGARQNHEHHDSSRSSRRPSSRDRDGRPHRDGEEDRKGYRHHSSRRSRSPPSRRRRSRSLGGSDREGTEDHRPSKKSDRSKSSRSHHRRKHSSGSSDGSSSGSEDDSGDEDRRKSRKKKSRHRHRSASAESGREESKRHRSKESREERRERKQRKKEKREKKKAKKAESSGHKYKGAVNEYGKFGIISEADMYTKDQEFRAWLVEEKMMNPETVPVSKMKELFRVYMEDYNTATLPHEKYYELEKYESKMNAIRSGQTTTNDLGYDPRADEAALAAQHKRVAKTDGEVYIGRAQLEELRKLERDRVEASRMKRMGMEVKESMGVRYERD